MVAKNDAKLADKNSIPQVGTAQAAITSPTGGATVDAQARTAIDAIRAVLSYHGLTL